MSEALASVLWQIFELAINAIECSIIIHFLVRYFGFKYDNYRKYIGIVIFFLLAFAEVTLINYFTIFEGIAILIPIIFYTIFCCVMLKGKTLTKLSVCTLTFLTILSINALVMSVASMISDKDIMNLMSQNSIYRAVPIIITKVVFFDLTQIVLRSKNKRKFELDVKNSLISTIILVMSISTIILVWEISLYNENIHPIHLLLPILGVIVSNIVVYYFIQKLNNEHVTKMDLAMMKQQQAYYLNEIKSIQELYNKVQVLKHDLSNYSSTMYQLIHEQKYQEAETYVQEHVKLLESIPSYISTENSIINSVVNIKLAEAVSKGIDIKYHILGELGNVTEYDLSIVIGNLFDNALEHCEYLIKNKKCENPCIKFSISNKKSYLVINMQNTIIDSVIGPNPKLNTTKLDDINHGIGIISIKNIAQKYDGMTDFYENNSYFCCNIILKT